MNTEIDICAKKHGEAETSRAAFERTRATLPDARNDVYFAVDMRGDMGLTAKEYAEQSGKPLNAVSGRFSELKKDGRIIKNGERRDGCAVHVAV